MNYYELLKVSEDAELEEIKKSYKKLVKQYHPDVYRGDKNFAESKIKELNEAYEILSDKSSRAEYDRILNEMRRKTTEIYERDDNTSPSSSFYQAEDLEKRYNEMYNYDYYKRYTTNYYGVDKSNQKTPEEPKTFVDVAIEKSKSFIDKSLQSGQTKLIVITMALLAILGLITVIILLGRVKALLKSSSETTAESLANLSTQNQTYGENYNSTVEEDLPDDQFANYLDSYLNNHKFNGVIKVGCNAFEITAYYGEPDSYEQKDGKIYAYYKDSYIIYDQNGFVIDFKNNGFFMTEDVIQGEYNQY